jgi:hypothetical protein
MADTRVGLRLPDWADQNRTPGMKFTPGTYAGIVKQNVDPLRMGRLRVWIPDYGGDEDVEDNWKWVTYASPFYGSTHNPKSNTDNTDEQSEHTYGMWFVPPDVGNTVLCTFINGDSGKGYWFAVATTTKLSHNMVPGVSSRFADQVDKTSAGGLVEASLSRVDRKPYLPLSEFNETRESNISGTFLANKIPVHQYQAEIIINQGLDTDPVRGATTSSSLREAPSSVFGISTPGRPSSPGDVVPTIRRGGHSFVMDDGDKDGVDQGIRLRTAGGHQILMNDKEQVLYIANSAGTSWLEFDSGGAIQMYSTSGFALRTQGALNLHSDTTVNIQGSSINMKATAGMKVSAQTLDVHSSGNMTLFGAKVGIGSGGSTMLTSGGTVGVGANGTLLLNGAAIKLNDGDVAQVSDPGDIQDNLHHDANKAPNGLWEAAGGTLTSIVTKAPTHEPYDRGAPVVPASAVSLTSFKNVCVDQPSSTGPAGQVSPGGAGPFGDFIAGFESGGAGYNAFNRGSSPPPGTGSPRESMNLENMTIDAILALMASIDPRQRLFAVGRYQCIPDTLRGACKKLNIPTTSKFSRDIQDNIFVNYLCKTKQPKINTYLSGGDPNDEAALLNACSATAGEWASIEDPQLNPVRGRYDGQGTNHAKGKTGPTKEALKAQWKFLHKDGGGVVKSGSGTVITDGSGNPIKTGAADEPDQGIQAASGKSVTKQAPAEIMKRTNAPNTGASVEGIGSYGDDNYIPGLTAPQVTALLTQIAYSESDFASDYNGGERIGRYGLNAVVLAEYGYIKPDYLDKYKGLALVDKNAWTGKDSVNSKDDLLKSVASQDEVMVAFVKDAHKALSKYSPAGIKGGDSVCAVAGMIYVTYLFRSAVSKRAGSNLDAMIDEAVRWRKSNTGITYAGKTPIDAYNEGRYAIDVLSVTGIGRSETSPSTTGIIPDEVLQFGSGNASKDSFDLLATNFKNALLLAAKAYKDASGKKIVVASLYRPDSEQERLYKTWQAAGGKVPGTPTAAGITTPALPVSMGGKVNAHGSGVAIDCGQQAAEISKTIDLSKFGLRWGGTFITPDPVHIQLASWTPNNKNTE